MWLQPSARHDWSTVPFKTVSEETKVCIPRCLEGQPLSRVLASRTVFSLWKSSTCAFASASWITSKMAEWPFWHCIQFYFSQLFGCRIIWVFQFCRNFYDFTSPDETQIKSFSDLLGCWSTWGREETSGKPSIFLVGYGTCLLTKYFLYPPWISISYRVSIYSLTSQNIVS